METNNIELGFSLFKEKLNSFLRNLNIFVILVFFLFFVIVLPYATLTGNIVDKRIDHLSTTSPSLAETQCNFDKSTLSREWLKSHLYKEYTSKPQQGEVSQFNNPEINKLIDARIEAMETRLEGLNVPIIGKIPLTPREIIIIFPIIIPIGLALFSLQFQELFSLRRNLLRLDKDNEFGIRIYANIPLYRVFFLLVLTSGIYLFASVMLFPKKYNLPNNQSSCNLYQIIKNQLDFQQHINVYNGLSFVSFLIFLASIAIFMSIWYPKIFRARIK